MTVSSSTDRATFLGNNATTVFALPFRFFANGEINAWLITNDTGALTALTLGTHYTLTGASDPEVDGSATGQLTMITPPTSAQSLFVQRIIPVTQPTDIVNQGQFFPEIHENVFDRLTMLSQQNAGAISRVIRVQDFDPEPTKLPSAAQRALKIMSFDADGNPVAIDADSDSSLVLRQDLANATDPAKGAGLVGYARELPFDTASTVSEVLNSQEVSIFEYADLVISKPNPSDISTWDWAPALQAAINSGFKDVTIPKVTIRIGAQVLAASDVTVTNHGTILITTDIVEAAIKADLVSGFKWIGGTIDARTAATYPGNIILIQNSDNCEISGCVIFDSPNNRYPLSPIRSLFNTKNTYRNVTLNDVADMGFQSYEDSYCVYDTVRSFDGSQSAIETNNGHHNRYVNCTAHCPLNVTYSAFSFNDKKSICSGNHTVGGAYGITVGHAAPFEANYSVVSGNNIDSPDKIGINIQATVGAVITGNVVTNVVWLSDTTYGDGIRQASGSSKCVITGNIIVSAQHGIRANDNTIVGMNQIISCQRPFRPALDQAATLYIGNIAAGAAGRPGFEFNNTVFAKNAMLVGNMAYDDQITPTMTYGFDTVAGVLLVGNASKGAVTDGFNGAGERMLNMEAEGTGAYKVLVTLTNGASFTTVNNDRITSRSVVTMTPGPAAPARDPYINAQNPGSVQLGHSAGTGGTVTLWIHSS